MTTTKLELLSQEDTRDEMLIESDRYSLARKPEAIIVSPALGAGEGFVHGRRYVAIVERPQTEKARLSVYGILKSTSNTCGCLPGTSKNELVTQSFGGAVHFEPDYTKYSEIILESKCTKPGVPAFNSTLTMRHFVRQDSRLSQTTHTVIPVILGVAFVFAFCGIVAYLVWHNAKSRHYQLL